MIPGKVFTGFAKILGNCQCKWLLVSSSAPRTFVSSFPFPEKFLFCTDKIEFIELPSLVPLLRIDDCFEIHILHWELCDLLLSSHRFFPLWAGLYHCVFCKKPSQFWFSSRCRNFGPSGSEHNYCASPITLVLAALNLIHEKNSRVRPWSRKGVPRTLSMSLILSLLVDAGCCAGTTASCDNDVGHVGKAELQEPVDKPGITIGTWYAVLHFIRLPSLMSCGFCPLVQWMEYPWSSQSFPSKKTAGVSSRSFTVTNKSNSLTYTIASSFVCTSPMAVTTVVGLSETLAVSNSAALRSFLLNMCMLAPESTTNSLFPRVFLRTALVDTILR